MQVGIVTPYRGQRDLIRDKIADAFGPQELSRVRVETIDSFQGKQLDVVILSLTRAGGGHWESNRGPPAAGAKDRRGQPLSAEAAGAAAAAAGPGSSSDGRQMLPLNRASVGFLSDVRRMNVAITRARLSCLILGRLDTLQQDAAWAALVADAAARGCLFQVPWAGALQQQHQRQQLLPLIHKAQQQQDELVVQLRKQRHLQLPPPPSAAAVVTQQQQQQQQGDAALLQHQLHLQQLNPALQHLQQQLGTQLGLSTQQQQQQQQQQQPNLQLQPTTALPQQQQFNPQQQQQQQQQYGSTNDGSTRPSKQQKLEHISSNPAPSMPTPAATAAAAAVASSVAARAAAAASGGQGVYQGMQPAQALIAWSLWPRVVELQQQILANPKP